MDNLKRRKLSLTVICLLIAVLVLTMVMTGSKVNDEQSYVSQENEAGEVYASAKLIDNDGNVDKVSALDHYNSLIAKGYTPVENQSTFDSIRTDGGLGVKGNKYALKPYDDAGNPIVYSTTTSLNVMRATLDGCGAKIMLNVVDDKTSYMFNQGYDPGLISNVGIPTESTFFQEEKISGNSDTGVDQKLRGGLANAADGATLSNIVFELNTDFYMRGVDEHRVQASYFIGGVFGTMANSTVTGCHFINNNELYMEKSISDANWGIHYHKWSRPYHCTISYGTLSAYVYNSTVSDVSLYLGPDFYLEVKTSGKNSGLAHRGAPRSVAGGLIGLLQNTNTVSNIYVKGSGAIRAISFGDYNDDSGAVGLAAKLGFAGAVIGAVSDSNSNVTNYLGKADGNAKITNIVSEWTGTTYTEGYAVYNGVNVFPTGQTFVGSVVGNIGMLQDGDFPASTMQNVYLVFDTSKYSNVRPIGYRATTVYNSSYINVYADGVILGTSELVDLYLNSDTNAIDITYNVPQGDSNAILWDYDFTDTKGVTRTTSFYNAQGVTSLSNATKNYTLSINMSNDKINYKYNFHTGHAYYYKVENEDLYNDAGSYTDQKTGQINIRTYNVFDGEYNATAISIPKLYFFSDEAMSASVIDSNGVYNPQWWGAVKNDFQAMPESDWNNTKNVATWYIRLNDAVDDSKSYDVVDTQNRYIAYKADNTYTSDELGEISRRYYKYNVQQKLVTPSLSYSFDTIYDGTNKVVDYSFGDQICEGDVVNATLEYRVEQQEGVWIPSSEGAKDVGNYKVVVLNLDNTNYTLPQDEVSTEFTVTKRIINVNFSGYNPESPYVYLASAGVGQVQMPTVTISGQATTDNQDAIIGVIVKNSSGMAVSASIDAGDYSLEVSLTDDFGAKNYDFVSDAQLTYNYTINKATLEYAGQEKYTFTYDSYPMGKDKIEAQDSNFKFVNTQNGDSLAISLKFKQEGKPSTTTVREVGVYTATATSTTSKNYEQAEYEFTMEILPKNIRFDIIPKGVQPLEDGNFVYTGENIWFSSNTEGIGDLDSYSFSVNIYQAKDVSFDSETGKAVVAEGATASSAVVNAGDYVAIIEEQNGKELSSNYTIDPSSLYQKSFTVAKKELVFTFNGETSLVYDGNIHTLSLNESDINTMVVERDLNKFTIEAVSYIMDNVDYKETGARNAGTYVVVPYITSTDEDINLNYTVIGTQIQIAKRDVAINALDVAFPYGLGFENMTDEQYRSLWAYPDGASEANMFIAEDEIMAFGSKSLVAPTGDSLISATTPRGQYKYSLGLNERNEFNTNYNLTVVYTDSTQSNWVVEGTQLDLAVVVTDNQGNEVVFEAGKEDTVSANAVYYGGDYNVTIRVNNAVDGYPEIVWDTASYSASNHSQNSFVFTLGANAKDAYYIGQNGADDIAITVNFVVDKLVVGIKAQDMELAYGDNFATAPIEYVGENQIVEKDIANMQFAWSLEEDLMSKNIGEFVYINLNITNADEQYDVVNNYTFEYAQGDARGKATLIRKVVVANMVGDKSKTYGDDDITAPQVDVDFVLETALVGDETLSVEYALFKQSENGLQPVEFGETLPVGEYVLAIVQTNEETSKYDLQINTYSKYTVNQKKVSIQLNETDVIYNGKEVVAVGNIEGIVGEDVVEIVFEYSKDGQTLDSAPKYAGVYAAEVVGLTNANYAVDFENVTGSATVTIQKLHVADIVVADGATPYGINAIRPQQKDTAMFTTANEVLLSDMQNGVLTATYVYTGAEDITGLLPDKYEGVLTLAFDGEAKDSYDIVIDIANYSDLIVTIAEINNDNVYLKTDNVIYDGNDHISDIVVVGIVNSEVDITVSKDGNIVNSIVDAGEYVVEVKAGDTGNYTGEATLKFTVEKAVLDAKVNGSADNQLTSQYDGNAVALSVDAKYGDVVFAITKDSNPVDEIKNAGTYVITVTAGENSNYKGSVVANYVVTKADIAIPTRDRLNIVVTIDSITVTDKQGVFNVLISLDSNSLDSATNSLTGLKDNTQYSLFIKMQGNENYNDSSVAVINVKTEEIVAPVLNAKDVSVVVYGDKIVINVNGTDAYAYSKDGGKTWQDSNTFASLANETEYTVSVKIKAQGVYPESNVVSVKVTTGGSLKVFNDLLAKFGDTIGAKDIQNYSDLIAAYDKLAQADKDENVDTTKFQAVKSAYETYISGVNADVVAAQNIGMKAVGKGFVVASAMLLAVAVAFIAKRKFTL